MKIVMLKWKTKPQVHPDDQLIPIEKCKCHYLPFDIEKAAKMLPSQVRKTYPRFFGECASCGYNGIAYSSFEHFVCGDW